MLLLTTRGGARYRKLPEGTITPLRQAQQTKSRWLVLHPDIWKKEGRLAWRWHPAELQEGQQQSARSGLAARGEKTGLLPAPYIGRVDLQQARSIPLQLSK